MLGFRVLGVWGFRGLGFRASFGGDPKASWGFTICSGGNNLEYRHSQVFREWQGESLL